jgi:hypothetical protein
MRAYRKYCVLALALMMGASPLAGEPAGSSSRYLVIVDTSRSMRRRSKAMLQTVQDLLSTGMQGELKGGETLGLWTFNQDLYTGLFPLQVWAPEEQNAIAQRAVGFLKAQGCERQPSLEKVIPALQNLVKDSELITVILISAGDARMRGTPFDDPINDYYARWCDEQQNGQVPLVTVLRARNGKMIRCSVRPALGPVEFPPLPPPEAPVVQTEPPAPVPAPQNLAPQMAPPLILSGKKLRPDTTQPPETQAPVVKVDPLSPGGGSAETAASVSHESVPGPASELAPEFPLFETSNLRETGAFAPEAAHPASPSVPALKPPASSIAPSEPSTTAPTPSGRPARIGQPQDQFMKRGGDGSPPVSLPTGPQEPGTRPSPPLASRLHELALAQPASPPPPNPNPNPTPNLPPNLESGRPARIVQPAPVAHVRSMRLWAGSILAGGCCLAFGLFRLRAARQASRLSIITCSLDGGGNKLQIQQALTTGSAPNLRRSQEKTF